MAFQFNFIIQFNKDYYSYVMDIGYHEIMHLNKLAIVILIVYGINECLSEMLCLETIVLYIRSNKVKNTFLVLLPSHFV